MDVLASTEVISFAQTLQQHKLKLQRQKVQTLQVNIGKRCNQACHHCHVESGPDRIENMTLATIDRLIHLLAHSASITHVDITGGAPEMNPHFRYFVSAIRAMNKQVIDRCNLTILFEPGQENTAEFLADNLQSLGKWSLKYSYTKIKHELDSPLLICKLMKLFQPTGVE